MNDDSPRRGAGLEDIVLGIPSQQILALEGPADAPGQLLDERLQLRRARRCDAPQHRRPGTRLTGPVEREHTKVGIEVERRPEALDQHHGAGSTGRAREPRCSRQTATSDTSDAPTSRCARRQWTMSLLISKRGGQLAEKKMRSACIA